MAKTTAKQVLDRVDALLPNGYERAEKLRWLAQAEGFVRREICREMGELPELTEETALTAETPFDELYRHYVESQIHYANGETARYNSAASLWNNAFLTYRGLLRPDGDAVGRRQDAAAVLRGGGEDVFSETEGGGTAAADGGALRRAGPAPGQRRGVCGGDGEPMERGLPGAGNTAGTERHDTAE